MVVGIAGNLLVHQSLHSLVVVLAGIEVAECSESSLVVRIGSIELLQLVDELHGVLLGLQVGLTDGELLSLSLLGLLGILHGDIEILQGAVHLLVLVGIESSEVSHLSEEASLTSLVVSLQELAVLSVEECAPVLQHTLLVAQLSLTLTSIHQLYAGIADASHVSFVELGFHLSLGIGHVIELVALNGIQQSIVGSFVVAHRVVGLSLFTSLKHGLTRKLGGTLLVELLHSKVHQMVVGLCFLGIVDQLAKRRLQHSCCLGIVLRFQDALQGFAVTCKRGRCGKQHQSRKHDFLHKLILMFKKVC